MHGVEQICARIRASPRGVHEGIRSLIEEALTSWTAAFSATTAIAVWEEREEPGVNVAIASGSDCELEQLDQITTLRSLTDPRLAQEPFFVDTTDRVTSRGRTETIGRALDPAFRERCPGPLLVIPVSADTIEAVVFLVAPSVAVADGLESGRIASELLAFELDAVMQWRVMRDRIIADERMRISRDLHDGLLQSFTGIVLQLETVHALLQHDPRAAARLITQVQAAIMADQRELRAYVEALRRRRRSDASFDFAANLHQMRERFEEQWGIRVWLDSASVEPHVSAALGQETFRIVQEALTNAARHGGASRIDVKLRTSEGMLVVDVTDDGVGLPVRGKLTLAEIREQGIGPASLADRISALNGQLTVDSTDTGLTLQIAVPLGWSGG